MKHQRFCPLYDRVLIRRAPESTAKHGAIEIPDSAKEPPLEGEVLAIGHGRLFEHSVTPLRVKVGDCVLFTKYSGTGITLDGEDLLIMREEEILGVLTN